MSLMLRVSLPAVLLALMAVLPGCGQAEQTGQVDSVEKPADPADHHDVPITEADVKMPANYQEAVARVKSYRDAIREGVSGSEPAVAHRPLDELDIVLRKLPTIARDSGVKEEQLETVNLAARQLRDSFNQVHAAIDERRSPDYASVEESIEKSIQQLEAIAQPTEG